MSKNIQLTSEGCLKHFLSIEDLNKELLTNILDTADSFLNVTDQSMKKLPLLKGKTVVNLFFENSTRTRTTFELAAKRLSADVLTINTQYSATSKGETLLDTIRNIQAMQVDMFVVRHKFSGTANFIAEHVAPHVSVVNAGDGCHSHPTQGMLDMYTIRHYKKEFSNLRVAIIGDVLHSRVARSQIHALNILGAREVRVIAPNTLLPHNIDSFGVQRFNSLDKGLKGVDVVMMLRLQNERMTTGLLPSKQEYYHQYGLTQSRLKLAKPDALVMHPGPINRGVEMSSMVADGPQSVILKQVEFGIAVRMAVMSMVLGNQPAQKENK